MSGDKDPRNEQLRALAAELREVRAKLEATESALASARSQLDAYAAERDALREQVAAPRAVGVEAYVLKTRLRFNGVAYERGAELPFDPANPPAGASGLIEGQHYERLRVLRAA